MFQLIIKLSIVNGKDIYTKCFTNDGIKGIYHTYFSSWVKLSGYSMLRFKIQKFSHFFKMNLNPSMVLYIFVACSIRMNFSSRWNIWFGFWKCVKAKISSFLLLLFRWLFHLTLLVFLFYILKMFVYIGTEIQFDYK